MERPPMSHRDNPEEAPQHSAAKEKLVATDAAWGATAARQVIPRVQAAGTKDEVRALLNELVRAIVREARTRFSDDPALADVSRVAAHEAACAQLGVFEWQGP